jgi:hypothetical protein
VCCVLWWGGGCVLEISQSLRKEVQATALLPIVLPSPEAIGTSLCQPAPCLAVRFGYALPNPKPHTKLHVVMARRASDAVVERDNDSDSTSKEEWSGALSGEEAGRVMVGQEVYLRLFRM